MNKQENLQSVLKLLVDTHPEIRGNHTEFARRTGTSQANVTRVINGDVKSPKDETIKPWADFFKITISELRGYERLPKQFYQGNFTVREEPAHYAATYSMGTSARSVSIPIKTFDTADRPLTGKEKYIVISGCTDDAYLLPIAYKDGGLAGYDYILIEPNDPKIGELQYRLIKNPGDARARLMEIIVEGDETYLQSANPKLADEIIPIANVSVIGWPTRAVSEEKPLTV